VTVTVCRSGDMERVPSVPDVYKLLVSACMRIANEQAVIGLNVAKLHPFRCFSRDYHVLCVHFFVYTQFFRNTNTVCTGATCFWCILYIQFCRVFELSECCYGCICFRLLQHWQCLASTALHNSPVFDLWESSVLFFLECVLKT
jgi:hypothetical protein